MALGKFSFREAISRPLRALLTLMSVAIGVGAVVAVLLSTSTTRQAQSEMLEAVTGQAQLEVVAGAGGTFADSVLKDIRENNQVAIAAPTITRFAVIFVGDNKARTQVLGIDPRIDTDVRSYRVASGRQPEKLSEIMLDGSFAASLGAELGSEIKILGRGGIKEYKLVGMVSPQGAESVSLGSAAYMVLPAAQRAFDVGRAIDKVLIKAVEDADVEALAMQLSAVVPEGVLVRPPSSGNAMARESIFATENALLMAIAFAMLIALFIIYNTFQMAVGERRRQLGILRAIGATQKQVQYLILREAVVLSIVGTLLGFVLGVLGAGFLTQATQALLQVELPRVMISWPPFVIASVFGIGVSLLGAILPARRAATVSPIEAMRTIELTANDEVIRYATPCSLVVFPIGCILLVLSILEFLPIGGDIVAVVLILLGYVLLIPRLLYPTSKFVCRFISRFSPTEVMLAQKQLTRHIGRSTLTIGVLFIASATTIGLAGNILDNVHNVRQWYERTFAGDFFVRASMPDLATGASADMPDQVGKDLAAMGGIEQLNTVRLVSTTSDGSEVLLVIASHNGESQSGLDLVAGNYRSVLSAMEQGQAVVGSVLAERRDLSIGDKVAFDSESGIKTLEVAGIANDYVGGGLTIHLHPQFAKTELGITGVDAYVMRASDGEMASVEQKLSAYCQENSLVLQSYADLVEYIDGIINGVIASLWMLLGLGCVIAAMGLVNTLTMNILEQTREIGMLRVVAMTRAQVRRMIVAGAVLFGLLGLVPGAIAGGFVAYAIGLSSQSVLGHAVQYHFRPGLVISCLALGLIIVLISSLFPAERAARLKLAAALQHE